MNAATRKRIIKLTYNLNRERKTYNKVRKMVWNEWYKPNGSPQNQRKIASLTRESRKIKGRVNALENSIEALNASFKTTVRKPFRNAVRQEAMSRRITSALQPFAKRISNIAYTKGLEREQARARANYNEFVKNLRAKTPNSPKRTRQSPRRAVNSGLHPRSPGTLAREAELRIAGGAKSPNRFSVHRGRTWMRTPKGKIIVRTN